VQGEVPAKRPTTAGSGFPQTQHVGVIHRHAVTRMLPAGILRVVVAGMATARMGPHEELPELQRAGDVPLAAALVRAPFRLDWRSSLPLRELRHALRHLRHVESDRIEGQREWRAGAGRSIELREAPAASCRRGALPFAVTSAHTGEVGGR
jgi:hypothetical protein